MNTAPKLEEEYLAALEEILGGGLVEDAAWVEAVIAELLDGEAEVDPDAEADAEAEAEAEVPLVVVSEEDELLDEEVVEVEDKEELDVTVEEMVNYSWD